MQNQDYVYSILTLDPIELKNCGWSDCHENGLLFSKRPIIPFPGDFLCFAIFLLSKVSKIQKNGNFVILTQF